MANMVTVLDCALARGAKEENGIISGKEMQKVRLPMFGGCERCSASLACYNAFPSTSGYLRCEECLGNSGFKTTEEFEKWCKENE